MKKLLAILFVLLSLSFGNKLFAGKYSDGYIIKNGDTILCQIRTPQTIQGLCQNCVQDFIITIDSTGKETKYLPTEIEGFGFLQGKERITFVSKVLKEGKPPIFIQIVVMGKKLILYSFMGIMYVDNQTGLMKRYPLRHYLLEDENKRTVIFENGEISNGKRMKEFFSDQPEILELYKQKRPNFYELPNFVNLVNSKM